MAPGDPSTWSVADWLLYAWGTVYLGLFVWHAVRLPMLQARAARGSAVAAAKFNAMIGRMPGRAYAKMFGVGPIGPQPE